MAQDLLSVALYRGSLLAVAVAVVLPEEEEFPSKIMAGLLESWIDLLPDFS